MTLAIILLAFAAQTITPPASTEPGCALYAKGEAHLPNVPGCKEHGTVRTSTTSATSSLLTVGPAPDSKPLVCPKYQHVEHWPGRCGPAPCDEQGCYAVCLPPPPDKCVDDMHETTEREWQELMQRVEKLEKEAKERQ